MGIGVQSLLKERDMCSDATQLQWHVQLSLVCRGGVGGSVCKRKGQLQHRLWAEKYSRERGGKTYVCRAHAYYTNTGSRCSGITISVLARAGTALTLYMRDIFSFVTYSTESVCQWVRLFFAINVYDHVQICRSQRNI
jgi:hypothetical protein